MTTIIHGHRGNRRAFTEARPQPFNPIPSGEILSGGAAGHAQIRPIVLEFLDIRDNALPPFRTSSAHVVFARLTEVAASGERVASFLCDGVFADASSLAALNCYLRSRRAMGRMHLPFSRLRPGELHRYAWSDFCAHLELNFPGWVFEPASAVARVLDAAEGVKPACAVHAWKLSGQVLRCDCGASKPLPASL